MTWTGPQRSVWAVTTPRVSVSVSRRRTDECVLSFGGAACRNPASGVFHQDTVRPRDGLASARRRPPQPGEGHRPTVGPHPATRTSRQTWETWRRVSGPRAGTFSSPKSRSCSSSGPNYRWFQPDERHLLTSIINATKITTLDPDQTERFQQQSSTESVVVLKELKQSENIKYTVQRCVVTAVLHCDRNKEVRY